MRAIDPNDPIYDGLTKQELRGYRNLSQEDKEAISKAKFGSSLSEPDALPPWEPQRDARWAALLGEVPTAGEPYRISHAEVMAQVRRKGSHRRQQPPTATVSGFTDWVLGQYVPPGNPSSLLAGLRGERDVVDYRAQRRKAKKEVPRWEHLGWKLIHDGVRGQFDGGLEIPTLKVNGEPLLGVPDLVFRERKTNRILIVELKVTRAFLPSDGWPNLRAQLWAYSRIGRWADATEVLLAGEVWTPDVPYPRLRKTYFWRADDALLQLESAELFVAYGGQISKGF